MITPEYDRGWKAAMKYVNEAHELRNSGAPSTGIGLMFSTLAGLVGLLWTVRLIRFGEWWPWPFLISVGLATLAVYAFRAGKREAAELAEKRRAFKERWSE